MSAARRTSRARFEPRRTIDARGGAVTPGFIDAPHARLAAPRPRLHSRHVGRGARARAVAAVLDAHDARGRRRVDDARLPRDGPQRHDRVLRPRRALRGGAQGRDRGADRAARRADGDRVGPPAACRGRDRRHGPDPAPPRTGGGRPAVPRPGRACLGRRRHPGHGHRQRRPARRRQGARGPPWARLLHACVVRRRRHRRVPATCRAA